MHDVFLPLFLLFAVFTPRTSSSPSSSSSPRISIPAPPAPWQRPHNYSPVSPSLVLHLRIALSLPESTIRGLAWNLSDPAHTSYGAHLSQTAISAILTPPKTSIDRVISWLESWGAENISVSPDGSRYRGGWVEFTSTVGQATKFLSASFERFQYVPEDEAGEAVSIIRSLTYTVPAEVADLVDFIHPITHFPRIKPARTQPQATSKSFLPPHVQPQAQSQPSSQRRTRTTVAKPLVPRAPIPESCVGTMTPSCLTTLYNINYAAPDNDTSPSQIGIAGFLEEYPNHDFVKDFLEQYGLPANRTPVDFTVEWINFANTSSIPNIYNSTTAGAEATLDLEYSMAYTNPIPVTYFYTAGRGPFLNGSGALQPSASDNEPYLEFLEYYLSLANPPQVLSISYTDTEQSVPYAYARRICTLFAALAVRGVSVLVAAGDGGVQGVGDSACVSNDGTNTTEFLPTFPASCPYVTAVGATNNYPETAASYTSGGFSDYFEVPEWQANATAAYISSLNGTYDGLYNASGRGIPDVSAFGDRFLVTYQNGAQSTSSGTSASTPVVAGMVALLNDERMRKGKSSLGWLNPMFYSSAFAAQAWQDVVEGFNYGCGTDGFPAGPGWDAITGLGTPLFDVLRTLAV